MSKRGLRSQGDEETEEASTMVAMDQTQFMTLLQSLQQSQADVFARLLSEVRTSTPVMHEMSSAPAIGANFTKCSARFAGKIEELDSFLDAVEVYKNCLGISDENAVKGLSLLLTSEAALWWQGVKATTTSWSDVITKLRGAFGERRPPFRIYTELFSLRQGNDTTDLFISKTRALLSKIPAGDLSEKVQLDLIYGLLDRRIRKRLDRSSITTFDDLLKRARGIEESLQDGEESKESPPATSTWKASASAASASRRRAAGTATETVKTGPAGASSTTSTGISATNSSGAGKRWYDKSQCKKSNESAGKKSIECYGCGTPNVIKSKCAKCKSSAESAFCSVTINNTGNASSKIRSSRRRRKRVPGGERQRVSCSPAAATRGPPAFACAPPLLREGEQSCDRRPNCIATTESERDSTTGPPDTRSTTVVADCTSRGVPLHAVLNQEGNPACTCCTAGDFINTCDSDKNMNVRKQCCVRQIKSRDTKANAKSVDLCTLSAKLNVNSMYSDLRDSDKSSISYQSSQCIKCCQINESAFCVTCSNGNNDVLLCVSHNDIKSPPSLKATYNIKGTDFYVNDLCESEPNSVQKLNSERQLLINRSDIIVGELPIIVKEQADSFITNSNKCLELSSYDICGLNKSGYCKKGVAHVQGRIQGESISTRPLLQIDIVGKSGTALLDTGAKGCIAGHSLHRVLVNKGHPLHHSSRNIRLADGSARQMDVLVANVKVGLFHKTVPTEFIIFPDARNNESLLGIDFIKKAGLVVNFKENLWHFAESSEQKYRLRFEPDSPQRTSYAAMNVLRDEEGSGLQEQERDELAQLLTEYRELFEPAGEPTPYIEHHIDTGNHAPIATPPYRLTPAKKEIMQQELDKMLVEDIVEDCESAWGAPALLVPKKDGKFRFCVDYRKLNSITKSDAYPMPRIDELLQSTKRGKCHMSTIDLRSGYWQVSVREEDRDKTAFSTPFGNFRFKRMPFGLKNGPATFQRLIDRMRSVSALKDVNILGYLDDLLIISEGGFSNHLEDLRIVLEQLRKFKLRANREKCVFVRKSVKYLGHVVSEEGVSADEEKIGAILDMEAPKTLKHLKSFIQTCSWFRKFIPGFSKVAQPLTKLTRKNQDWMWGTEQIEAFATLKKLLTTAPILIQADYAKPFILRTDASNYAIGAVLLQGEKNEERPIEFASRLLTGAERNYSTTEREALAVVWAVDRFRGYIDGHPVIVGSDHQPLKWLLSLKSPSGRLVRWALKLQAYDLQFEYVPGKVNVVADTLSRPFCNEESRESCGICSVVVDLPTRDITQLRAEQEADPDIYKIIRELEDTEEVATRRWTERGYMMERGILYRYNPDTDNESPQLVIPASMREEILRECHDAPVAGHPGIDRTYQKVSQDFFFPGMRRIITNYVKSCTTCQRYKATNEKPQGLIQTPLLNQRNEVLAIDLFGPLPEAKNGEKWILLVEDTATRWVELYALKEATSVACAKVLIEEYFLRYGLPRRVISDNGVQFVSAVMQKCMHILNITQDLTPFYHPEANPAERKNRDMKTKLALLVGTDHTSWPNQLPIVRFSMNSAVCDTTGVTPAYLSMARELRSPLEVYNDPRAVLEKANFVPQITPYLTKFLNSLARVRERVEEQQDKRKSYADKKRRAGEEFKVGDKVLLASHLLSDARKSKTTKFYPRRDGPYVVKKKLSPTTYLIASDDGEDELLGKFHANELTPFQERGSEHTQPVNPKRKRGRPRKQAGVTKSSDVRLDHDRGRVRDLEGEYVAGQPYDSTPNVCVVGQHYDLKHKVCERDRRSASVAHVEGPALLEKACESTVCPPRRFPARISKPRVVLDL